MTLEELNIEFEKMKKEKEELENRLIDMEATNDSVKYVDPIQDNKYWQDFISKKEKR